MDTTDPKIVFDDQGQCNHCTEYIAVRAAYSYHGERSDKQRDEIVDRIKRDGRDRDFDCVIGVSGGADSSYVAYIVKEFGLRPLAVHMDNGWNSEESVRNIHTIISKLKIDYESYVLDWEEFKDIQVAFLKASVPEADTPTDQAIGSALHHYASKYRVKHIISGGNMASEGILPKSWHYNAKDLVYFKHIHKTFGEKPMKKYKTFGYFAESYYKFVKGIRYTYLLNYMPFDKEEATQLLVEKLGWKKYGQKHFESRYTKWIQAYYLFEKFGIDYRRATFSSEICLGQVDRHEALDRLVSLPYDPVQNESDMIYIAKKLKLTDDELSTIVQLPPKWYWDYPNDDRRLSFFYDTYRRMVGAERLSSS